MADTETFSAMQFWKTVEKKNAAIVSKSAPVAKKFTMLKPPPDPEDEQKGQVEWDEQNVTDAFDFWKKKAIEIKDDSESKSNYRKSVINVRTSVTLEASMPRHPSTTSTTTTTSTSTSTSPSTSTQSLSDALAPQTATGTVAETRSDDQSQKDGHAPSVVDDQLQQLKNAVQTVKLDDDQMMQPVLLDQAADVSSSGSVEDSSSSDLDSAEEISDDEYSEDMIKNVSELEGRFDLSDQTPTIQTTAAVPPAAHADLHHPTQHTLPSDSPIRMQFHQTEPLNVNHPSAVPITPPKTTPKNSPKRSILPKSASKSISSKDKADAGQLSGTPPSSDKPPKESKDKKPKKEKTKVDKTEKERLKQEKRDKKNGSKKSSTIETNATKAPPVNESKIKNVVEIESVPRVFRVRLTKLFAVDDGLPQFISSALTFLTNFDIIDVAMIFQDAHLDPIVKGVRASADETQIDFSKINSPRVVGGLLRMFFAELPQPLFNTKFYNNLLDIHDITKPEVKLQDLRSLIWSLSILRRNFLQLFVTFLTQKYVNKATNKAQTITILASTFGPTFFRPADAKLANSNMALREESLRIIIENLDYLFTEAKDPDIVFKNEDGKLLVSEATIDKLVDKATDLFYHHCDAYFSLVFFVTHNLFITPNDLVDKLIALYKENHIESSKKKWKKTRSSKKEEKISEAVKLWVDYCYRELREDKKLSQKILKGFPHLEAALSSRLSNKAFAFSDILKVPKHFHSRKGSGSFDNLLLMCTSGKDQALIATEIAEQATLADFQVFANLRSSDWVRLVQGSVDAPMSPNLTKAIKRSAEWTQWTMGEILQVEDKIQRVMTISLMVEVATICCTDLCNFNVAIAILNALNNHHIKRLTASWDAVPKDTVTKLNNLNNLLSPWLKLHANSYQQIVGALGTPCVPHFATIKSLLQQFDTSMPTKTADGAHINVDKLRHTFLMVSEMQKLQQRAYPIKATKLLFQFQELNAPNMDLLAEWSLKIEPPPQSKNKRFTVPAADDLAQVTWQENIAKTFAKPLAQTSTGIDLPRLACFFTIGQQAINTGSKVTDIHAVVQSLAKLMLNDSDVPTPETPLAEHLDRLDKSYQTYIPFTTPGDADVKRDLLRYLEEVVGAESKVVNALKCCNQAIIAPAVIELTLKIAKSLQFMDAQGGWRIEVERNETNNIVVRHRKRQKSRSTDNKEQYEFEWSLSLMLDDTCKSIASSDIKIQSITLSPETSEAVKEQLKSTLSPYFISSDCIKEGMVTASPPLVPAASNSNNNSSSNIGDQLQSSPPPTTNE
ncbi:hypothetical protein SAMD00019534_123440 [Acytostelium subglobosum LB1]|uniref:hypothetical protein n=1 Tax=Acytostelium subglobosum LB1 TaxID=1410327 RepID=UPI0006447F87|nr:hypothetical protein SAMD00019534_123440 [Acytostelium subglobosum LB1]GAM29168.1 hypothetical protein SAMD00019534_123440 [Acytostelium subglobosum LB1]|eukprot:XP_012747859.1 hypothetical protein SAMD00019534_123440 [Acytostelium subglobosum LB1]